LINDREIWESICRGDARSLDGLYRTLGPKLEVFLRRVLGNRQAAEDVLQETFTGIWEHPNGFEPERGTLRAYVFGAARKCAADWWRKQGVPRECVPTETAQSDGEGSSILADALSRLPEDARTLIWLREVEGYSYEELAQILEIPSGTVGSRLFAAREELRRIWQAIPERKKGQP
jgi:RNA polymerase sigma-70 factor, ECF subfamily